jgi:adenylosuccinate synthase
MTAIAVIGAQWGDEGKGKIIDMLSEKADFVVRFSGGDNAGHTVINNLGTFALHIIPSGIFYNHTTCIIGNGTVVNPAVLLDEMDMLRKSGVDLSRLYLSDRTQLIMPYHVLQDGLEEEALGKNAVGTTRKGVGPAFTDKAARRGIRAGELLDKKGFLTRLETVIESKNLLLTRVYGQEPLKVNEIYEKYCEYGERLAPHIKETTSILSRAFKDNKKVLMEGAQGVLLDPDFGTYPFATSSSPLAGGACLGAGISPRSIENILAVYKAYCTRVGGGPMPTELHDEYGDAIRNKAHEFGTTTGRPRRCGWFDGVAAGFSNRINGYTGIALTRLDVLDEFSEIKVCVAYKLDGQTTTEFPSSVSQLARCEPVYETLEGWMIPTSQIRHYDDLPEAAKNYIKKIEEVADCPVKMISIGPKRDETILRYPIM